MGNSAPASAKFGIRGNAASNDFKETLSLAELKDAAEAWLLDGQARLSPKTVGERRYLVNKLILWLETEGYAECGKRELVRFFSYLRTAHTRPEGRWGTPGTVCDNPRLRREVRPRTAGNYFRWLRTFFYFCVEDGTLDASPLRTMRPPVHRDDQIQPFTTDQVQALLKAVRTTRYARRDEALILLLLDTGARAAEVCGLKVGDFSIRDRSVRVRGKGDTHRVLFLTSTTTRAILHYLRDQRRGEDDPLFVSEKPSCAGDGLTPHGLGQVIKRVGAAAGIEGVRCSPHTFRHTFAVEFLRNGGDPLTLQSLYGHTSLEMTRRYVLFSQADRKRKHGQFSPVAHLKRPR